MQKSNNKRRLYIGLLKSTMCHTNIFLETFRGQHTTTDYIHSAIPLFASSAIIPLSDANNNEREIEDSTLIFIFPVQYIPIQYVNSLRFLCVESMRAVKQIE